MKSSEEFLSIGKVKFLNIYDNGPKHTALIVIQKISTHRTLNPNLENMVDGAAVRSLIPPVWFWRRRKCVFFLKWDYFFAIHRRICPKFGIIELSL